MVTGALRLIMGGVPSSNFCLRFKVCLFVRSGWNSSSRFLVDENSERETLGSWAERRRLRDQWLHQLHFTCHLSQPWETLGWRPGHQVTGLCAIIVWLYRRVPRRHGRVLSLNLGFLRRKVRTGLVSFLTSELAQGAPQRRALVWAPLRGPAGSEWSTKVFLRVSLARAPGSALGPFSLVLFSQTQLFSKCAGVGESQVCFRGKNLLFYRAIIPGGLWRRFGRCMRRRGHFWI